MSVLKENLLRDAGINDKARKVTLRGKQVIVPLKFDEDGNPTTTDRLIFKRLSLLDLRFLQALKKSDWNVEKARLQIDGMEFEKANRLLRKLSCFREEEAKVKALCEIPTPDWIAAKHVENVYDGGTLQDSQQKSLAELAKIEGAYKQQTPATQINVFNLPKLTPEVEAEFKALAEKALDTEQVA